MKIIKKNDFGKTQTIGSQIVSDLMTDAMSFCH